MSEMKSLAKDTAIYGISSIVGKFLNYLLVPLYTYVLKETSDYGIVTNLYAWTALLLVILTYGLETGFFRFANREDYDPMQVYKTSMRSLLITSSLFAGLCVIFRTPIANVMGYPGHSNFIAMMAVTVALDAFASIPFAYLRYRKKAMLFAGLKLLFVVLNIGFNLLFLVVLGWQDVTYVFVSNVLATAIQTAILMPMALTKRGEAATKRPEGYVTPRSGYVNVNETRQGRYVNVNETRQGRYENVNETPRGGYENVNVNRTDWEVWKELMKYSLPLLVLGVAGIMNQTLDRILFPYLYTGADAQAQLGIYGACFKVAMVMMMFTQAFRYAYEPFVFSKHKDRQSVEAYADAMKYYIIFSLLILLGVTVYLDIFKYIIGPSYWEGLRIVPVVLWTYVFQGIYFNLSFWYKLTDETKWGAWFSLIGLVITLVLQVVGVPRIGYWASCGSSLVCYLVIMLISYFMGRKRLHIPYDLKRIGMYFGLTVVLLAAFYAFKLCVGGEWLTMGVGTLLIGVYLVVLTRRDFPVKAILRRGKK